MSEKLHAITPTRESAIYPTFGIDIVKPAEWAGGTPITEMEPVEWIELNMPFPETEIVAVAQAALGRDIIISSMILEDAGDYLTVEVLNR